MDGIIAVTYRCNCKCVMCDTWRYPSDKDREIRASDLETLPQMVRLNITGGEPFLRDDLGDILTVAKRKAKRVVISSNGVLTKRTLEVMSSHRDVGVRLSFDGLSDVHEGIRGVPGIHGRALETLRGLKGLGIKDLGIAVTISDRNATQLVPLYRLAKREGVELATAILHNAYYFHKEDNRIDNKPLVEKHIKELVREYLCSSHPKDWFRAYFTKGIADHMHGKERSLKCTMATDSFFVDPYGAVRPCNVMNFPFGNIREKSFTAIWNSPEAVEARRRVDCCTGNCWMIGSVGHLMRQQLWTPFTWIVSNKWFKGAETA
ncbi:radical SAM protein [Geobacter pelophilus]|uniref:Radical SAM protein n=1 Tax=Geoanaerobacter pelophilus TaxID=60036 RepID=A0AAW4LAR9_9BACT|nr:radical SAM protein [Geoanaerobacter pelophilus]MBT0666188.1 radical SAM protein [Geoanaerobacter pelophilus]